jgi:Transglycosylase
LTPQHPSPLRRPVRYGIHLDRHRRIALGIALVTLVLASLTFAPLVRTVASRKAAARGLAVEIDRVWPGWLSVHLADITVGLDSTPAVSARFAHIEVLLTPWLSLRGFSVDGGEITLAGSADTLREQLEAWRARRRTGSDDTSVRSSSQLSLDAQRIDVSWRDGEGDATPQTITGISFERKGERARAGFASAKLESDGTVLTLSAGAAEFASGPDGLALTSARIAQLLGRVSLAVSPDAPTADTSGTQAPNVAAASELGDDEESADAVGDGRDAVDAKAANKTGQQSLADRLAPLAAASWPKRREQIDALRKLLRARIAESARFDIAKVQLEVTHGASLLNFGPAPLSFERRAGVASASFLPPAEKGGKRLTLQARLPLEAGPIELNLEGGPISLSTLGVHEGDFGLLGVNRSELTLSTHVELSPEGTLDIAARGRLDRLSLEQAALAPEPLRDVNLTWGGQIRLDLGKRRFAIEDGSLGVEEVRVTVAGSIEASESDVRVRLNVEIPKTSCQDLLSAAPAALLPQLQGLRLGGTFALHSRVALDTSDLAKTEVEWDFDNRCKVLETPEDIDPKRFHEPFQHYVVEPDGRATEFTTGPTTEQWVALNEITPNMETGLIVCEDSRFFKHNGFDNKAIRDSILSNLKKGHFVRGASTLSMQLAKNLYLGREKTLSRKLQEAAFTLLLEERLSKEDILELYLNVVEFGPGIYGIRNAAMHYFNSHPGELSLAQAMFLASILPNPKANHFQADGALKPAWTKHLQYLMRVARKINRIGDDELEAGTNEHLMFGQAHPDASSDFLFGAPIYDVNDG